MSNIHTKKITITLVIFFSLLTLINLTPVTSAGFLMDMYSLKAQLEVSYDKEAANFPILPIDMVKKIPVTIYYSVYGKFADNIANDIPYVEIKFDINETLIPDWFDVTPDPPNFLINSLDDNLQTYFMNLTIIIYEDSHAFKKGNIPLKISCNVPGKLLEDKSLLYNVTFNVGYLPILKIDSSGEAHELIGPGESKNFDIQIENLGNGITNVYAEVINPPKDWTIRTTSFIQLGFRQENNKGVIPLTIKPPDSFGYHEEIEVIQIKLIPAYFDNESLKGSEYILSYIIKSEGFSTVGIELAPIFIIILLFIYFIISRLIRWRRKDEI